MTKVFRITPLEKKNVEVCFDVFEETDEGTIRSWHVEELYRWGLGFRHLDNPISEWELKSNAINCDTDAGSGAELDDLINVSFNFDASFSEEEKREIENLWYEGGAGWLYDGEHNWQVDYDSLVVYGPVKIDLIDDITNEIFEENIQPTSEGAPMDWQTISDQEVAVWPFPTQKNFGETDKNS
jgi:hypothetical protein